VDKMGADQELLKYDFSNKDPNEVLTKDELEHFDEGMKLKNESRSASTVDFEKAARTVAAELDELLA
jgi:hypothetical protein